MITHTKAYKTSTGKTFDTLDKAQADEINMLLFPEPIEKVDSYTLSDKIVANKDKIMDILSTKENSRTRARKINGSVRKSRAQVTQSTAKA